MGTNSKKFEGYIMEEEIYNAYTIDKMKINLIVEKFNVKRYIIYKILKKLNAPPSRVNDKIVVKCYCCGTEFKKHQCEINKNPNGLHFCSKVCKNIHFSKPESNPNYIHDRSLLKDQNKSIRWSSDMKEWRKAVYERDSYTCQICGNKSCAGNSVTLNSHHIIRFTDDKTLRFSVDNGITLCEYCHKLTYRREQEFEHEFKLIVAINASGLNEE